MAKNITIHSAVNTILCGSIEFTLNFNRQRYILSFGNSLNLSKMEYKDNGYEEQERVQVTREQVLELIDQGDTGYWSWNYFIDALNGFAEAQNKNKKSIYIKNSINIMQMLVNEGYKVNETGDWTHKKSLRLQ